MPIIKMQARNDESIFVEVDIDKSGLTRGTKLTEITERAREYAKDFDRVGDYIILICDEIYNRYQKAAEGIRPTELGIEFGIKISGEGGIPFISKGAAEATIKVTAKWNTDKKSI